MELGKHLLIKQNIIKLGTIAQIELADALSFACGLAPNPPAYTNQELVDSILALDFIHVNHLVDSLCSEFNINKLDIAHSGAAAAQTDSSAVADKLVNIKFASFDPTKKIPVIMAIKNNLGLDLAGSRQIITDVETGKNVILFEKIKESDKQAEIAALLAAGITIDIIKL